MLFLRYIQAFYNLEDLESRIAEEGDEAEIVIDASRISSFPLSRLGVKSSKVVNEIGAMLDVAERRMNREHY